MWLLNPLEDRIASKDVDCWELEKIKRACPQARLYETWLLDWWLLFLLFLAGGLFLWLGFFAGSGSLQ